jgi:hypothetical protein
MPTTPLTSPVPQVSHDIPRLDMRRVRGLLAEHRVQPAQFAAICGLSRAFTSTVLHEHRNAGRLTRLLMLQGLAQLGISAEEVRHAA